jgi:uncharacterized protein (TIGR02246 family)
MTSTGRRIPTADVYTALAGNRKGPDSGDRRAVDARRGRQYAVANARARRALPKEDDVKRSLLFATFAMALGGSAHALDPSVGAGLDASRRNLQAETEVRQRYTEFTDAFNRHDTAAMAAMWTAQGDHYEPDGSFAEGREAVRKLFEASHSTGFKTATITLNIDSVWMITPNVALVNGFYAVDGVRDPAGKEVAIRKGHLTSVLLKDEGQWWVAASRATIPVPLPWRKPPPE